MTIRTNRHAYAALAIAFVSKNAAIGFTFGAYGLMVSQLESTFEGSRAGSSLGIGLIALTMGLASPMLGYALDRWSIRKSMCLGYLVGAAGFWFASSAESLEMFLFSFGVIVGMSVAATGVLPASKIATNWFPDAPGKAIAFANLPLVVAIGPPVFGAIIAAEGWRTLMLVFSLIFVALAPLMLLLRDAPKNNKTPEKTRSDFALKDSLKTLLSDPRFWLTTLIAGSLFSGGIVMVTHIVAHAITGGTELQQASILLSVNGAAAVFGAFLFGWISDRYNPHRALIINASAQIIMWPTLVLVPGFGGLVVAVMLLGLCIGGAHPSVSAMINYVFGQSRFATVLGQVTLFVIPLNFGAAPLAGYLFDVGGNYGVAFGLQSILCIASLVCIKLLTRMSNENLLKTPLTSA